MNGHRVKQFRAELRFITRSKFRRVKKDYNRPPSSRVEPFAQYETTDSRDKMRFAHGKMKRAGIFATRPRS